MKKSLLLPLLVYVSILSCQKSVNNRILDDIESYIQTKPDSALTALSRIDTSSLRAPKMRAQYALLLAMALDKNYIDTTDLSVIRPAVEYYQGHGTPRQKMLAYYYEGRILYNGKRDAEAFLCQAQALENAKTIDADRYLGLIYSSMADLSNRAYCWEEASGLLLKAQNAFLSVKDTIASLQVMRKRVKVLSNQGQTDLVLSTIDSLLTTTYLPNSLYADFLSIKAASLVDTTHRDYLPAIECFEEALKAGASLTIKQKARYAYALARCGHEQASNTLFSLMSSSSDENADIAGSWIQELQAANHQYESAYWTLRRSLDYQASRVNQVIDQSLFRTQRDYFKTKEEAVRLQNRNQRLSILLLVTSLALSLICICIILHLFRRKVQSKKLEMERLSESLSQIINEKEHSYKNLHTQFCHIHKEQFKLLEKYYKDFEMARRSGAGEKELYHRLLAIVKDIEGDTDGQRYLDALIDEQYDGVMKKLSSECPNLSKQDYLLFSYTAAGFDSSTIGMLFGNLSADALHTRRSRLRKALKSINPMSLQDFLGLLDRR